MQRKTHLSLAGLLALIAVSLTACVRDSVGPPGDPRFEVSEVMVSPSLAAVAVGTTVQLTASVSPSTGVVDRTVNWSSSDTTVARVDQTGMVTGVRIGVATIIVTSNQNPLVKGAAAVTVADVIISSPVTISANQHQSCTASGECTSMPANLTTVAGQVDVVLNIGADPRFFKSAQVTMACGSRSITVERTDINMIPDPPPHLITLSINTLQADSTGAPTLPNGRCDLTASATALTGVQSATSGTQFTLNNVP